jgi:hypothetical protein
MEPAMSKNILLDARAEALFASNVSAHEPADRDQVDGAIRVTMRLRRVKGCVAYVAQEFGDHPETAVVRMRWAVATVTELYTERRCGCVTLASTKKPMVGAVA